MTAELATYGSAMGRAESETDPQIEAFIARRQGREGGQERANYALFLTGLCNLAWGRESPGPTQLRGRG